MLHTEQWLLFDLLKNNVKSREYLLFFFKSLAASTCTIGTHLPEDLLSNVQYLSKVLRMRSQLYLYVYMLCTVYSFQGIGVDDIFVIVQTWENIAGSIDDKEPIPEKISRTMRHAVSCNKEAASETSALSCDSGIEKMDIFFVNFFINAHKCS